MKIGFFDSGLGGLTIFNKAIQKIPYYDFVYFADNKNAPYGIKDRQVVKKYIFDCVKKLIDFGCEAIVIACNTATSIAIDDLRDMYPNKIIIGTEPAIKKAVEENKKSNRILVCATSITVKEKKLNNLINELNAQDIIDLLPLDKLVEYVEGENIDTANVNNYLNEKFKEINKDKYSHVVLGCTHFPILKKQFEEIFPSKVKIIDGSDGVINNLIAKVNGKNDYISDVLKKVSTTLLLTKHSEIFINNFKRISGLKYFNIEIV